MQNLESKNTVINNRRANMYGTNDLHALRTIVAGKSKTEVVELSDVGAVVFIDPSRNVAMGFSAKRSKADFHYVYTTRERMMDAIERYRAALQRTLDARSERKSKQQALDALPNPFKVGDILHYSWGWEQTQCEFFQVVEVKSKTVTIRAIASEFVSANSSMSGHYIAVKDKFLDGRDSETLTKRVKRWGEDHACVSMPHGSASLWDGKPKYCSWYA